MRLAEAIRKGAMQHPQWFGMFRGWRGDGATEELHTCALMAAHEGVYGELPAPFLAAMSEAEIEKHVLSELHAAFPQLKDAATAYTCPAGDRCNRHPAPPDRYHIDLRSMIVHLNDYHRWTRECIADWVESVERG